MTYAAHVPQDDLLNFHARTYGRPYEAWSQARRGFPEEHQNYIGCYTDGTPRLLTDEQIQIFRHSEIHALLQAHRRHVAAGEDCTQSSEGEISSTIESKPIATTHVPADVPVTDENAEDEDEEAEYTRFLENERREFEQSAAARRREQEKAAPDPFDRSISTRRRVREMDAIDVVDQALDYGDETATDVPQHASDIAPKDEQHSGPIQGRKIWWPSIEKA